MKVLALSSYPTEAAATRFRVEQYIRLLADRGIKVELKPFLTGDQFRSLYGRGSSAKKLAWMAGSVGRRLVDLGSASKYDLLFVQREAMPFGPAIFEQLYQAVGRLPIVLDLDDATYVSYVSPTHGRLGSALKFFGKTDKLIRRSELVICGNRFIAEYATGLGARTLVIPTVVNADVFRPRAKLPEDITRTVGWIGTHSTFPFLESLFPLLESLAKKHQFRLKIVGAGRREVRVEGVEVEKLDWDMDREVEDFQSLDIGLYPITVSASASEEWINGKSGFKAVQYMAVGIPFVMSPVGACAEMGFDGRTHFNARNDQDWYNCLDRLLSEPDLRRRMGTAGRELADSEFSVRSQVDILADALRSVIAER